MYYSLCDTRCYVGHEKALERYLNVAEVWNNILELNNILDAHVVLEVT